MQRVQVPYELLHGDTGGTSNSVGWIYYRWMSPYMMYTTWYPVKDLN